MASISSLLGAPTDVTELGAPTPNPGLVVPPLHVDDPVRPVPLPLLVPGRERENGDVMLSLPVVGGNSTASRAAVPGREDPPMNGEVDVGSTPAVPGLDSPPNVVGPGANAKVASTTREPSEFSWLKVATLRALGAPSTDDLGDVDVKADRVGEAEVRVARFGDMEDIPPKIGEVEVRGPKIGGVDVMPPKIGEVEVRFVFGREKAAAIVLVKTRFEEPGRDSAWGRAVAEKDVRRDEEDGIGVESCKNEV